MKFWFLYSTVGNQKDAKRIARHLLKKQLIACANIFPIDSQYWWQDKIVSDKEYGMIMKTSSSNYQKIEQEIKKLHPYECFCLVAFEVKSGFLPYLKWLKNSITK